MACGMWLKRKRGRARMESRRVNERWHLQRRKGGMPLHPKMGRKKSDFENHNLVPMRERTKDQGPRVRGGTVNSAMTGIRRSSRA